MIHKNFYSVIAIRNSITRAHYTHLRNSMADDGNNVTLVIGDSLHSISYIHEIR